MNTMQLILLWYGGLAVVAILLFMAMTNDSAWLLIAAIATLTALAIVTFATGTQGRRRWVAVWVAGPILLVAVAGFGWSQFTERRATRLIPADQVEMVDVEFFTVGTDRFTFRGRLRNRSAYSLTAVLLEFTAHDGSDVIDRTTVTLFVRVPPGEVREFKDETVYFSRDTVAKLAKRTVTYQYRRVGTRGETK
jgi:hypothetical protein